MPITGFVNKTTGLSTEGGHCVRYLNGSGATINQYEVVNINPTSAEIRQIPADNFDPIGVAYENILNGQYGWVVVSGVAQMKFDGNTTRGHLAVVSPTGAGKGNSIAVPSGTPSQTSHWQEMGHILDTVANGDGSIARVNLHFN